MREHMGLFRGKRKDNGEWVIGYLCRSYYKVEDACICCTATLNFYSVDPTTIGECTGETDKNGKLIYEKDIVNGNYNDKYVVEYGRHDLSCCGCCHDSHEAVGFYLKNKYGYPHSDDEAWHGLEIIGNAIDNPELLKGGEGNG